MTKFHAAAIAFAAGLVLAAFSLPAYAQTVQGSDSSPSFESAVRIPWSMKITIKNPSGIGVVGTDALFFDFNEQCEAAKHGSFEKLGETKAGLYVVEYLGGKKIEGLTCPDGTVTTVEPGLYDVMEAEYQAMSVAEESEAAEIEAILAKRNKPPLLR